MYAYVHTYLYTHVYTPLLSRDVIFLVFWLEDAGRPGQKAGRGVRVHGHPQPRLWRPQGTGSQRGANGESTGS